MESGQSVRGRHIIRYNLPESARISKEDSLELFSLEQ